jgi:hypothetical protein
VRYAGPAMHRLRELAKRVLPENLIEAYRRRRAARRYLRTLGAEVRLRNQQMQVEELEGKVLAKRPEITDRLVKDLLERVDLVVQQLDRQLEAIRARHGNELRSLRDEVDALKTSVAALEAAVAPEPQQPRPAAVE